MPNSKKLVIYLPDLVGGGVPILYLRLAPYFSAAGYSVRFLVNQNKGELVESLAPGIDVIELGASRQLFALPRLIPFLKKEKPDILLSAIEHMHIMASLARLFVRSNTRHIVTQHNPLSQQAQRPGLDFKLLPLLYRLVLPFADAIVAVSKGVADDMAQRAPLDRKRVEVLYNGVVTDDFDIRASQPLPTNWPQSDGPILITVGRLAPQKDHITLLRAVAAVKRLPPPDLVFVGTGNLREKLAALASELGIGDRVHFLGYSDNPLPAVKNADLFVLSSIYEGFGLVLVEALACGTPVVSTNCPHGPDEILDGGRYGRLTRVGDHLALARAIEETLDNPPDRELLKQRGRQFSVRQCAEQHITLFERVLA